MPVLHIQTSGEEAGYLFVQDGDHSIGRSRDCAIHLSDKYVSRNHARLTCEGDQCFLEDLESRQGTLLNGQTMEGRVALESGDRVKIGGHELLLESVPAEPGERVFSTYETRGRFVIQMLVDFSNHRYADIQQDANRVIARLTKYRPPKVAIDLSSVTFLPSVGIGTIVAFAREAKVTGTNACLCGASESVLSVLQTMSLFKLWPNFASLEGALENNSW